ncbi:MAG: class I SAM-dependent methyltransferase [Bacteroidetes bacterium]|nr:MAG: class I SAM-dependent methyltransferase [Bacteroidota bacterium]
MSSHERAHHDEANNVTYQRCQYAYEFAVAYIEGKKVLDVGCGNGYGTALMAKSAREIVGLDYDAETVEQNKKAYSSLSNITFKQAFIPPIPFEEASFDVITAFQFIEHIESRKEFLKECLRVLRPGGILLVTTPNALKSLARNPFHVHEYTFSEMDAELKSLSTNFELQGLNGNESVNQYYAENGKFVRMILKWDIFKLHQRLPAGLLTKPYNLITNLMRKKLKENLSQTSGISTKDFFLQKENLDSCWDIYLIARK